MTNSAGAIAVAVSGGHHQSSAISIGPDYTVSACAFGDSLNLHTFDQTEVGGRILDLLSALARRLGMSGMRDLERNTAALTLALPGAATDYDQRLAHLALLYSGWTDESKVNIVDDTWAGLVAGCPDAKGISAIAGTGASVFVGIGSFDDGRRHKLDGWGPVLGDFGSGFQLAIDFFRHLCREYDRGNTPPLLDLLLKDHPQLVGMQNIQPWFDSLCRRPQNEWRVLLSTFASVVTKAASTPEAYPDAVPLVESAAREMAETIGMAIRRFSPDTSHLPILCHGGMFEHSALYRQTIKRALAPQFQNPIHVADFRPVIGAGLLSLLRLHRQPAALLHEGLTRSLSSLSREDEMLLRYPSAKLLM